MAIINHYLGLNYELVDGTTTYNQDGVKFGLTADNNYVVHLVHGTESTSGSATVTETIHYVYSDGTKAADDHTATLTFTHTGTTDKVSGNTTWNDDWTAETTDSFAAVTSPTITGYTADQTEVAAVTGVTGDTAAIDKTVTYTANAETATITFIDDDTGDTLTTATGDGSFGAEISFAQDGTAVTVADLLAGYTDGDDAKYVLVSNDYTDGATYQDGPTPTSLSSTSSTNTR